jgi:hypothetical protein
MYAPKAHRCFEGQRTASLALAPVALVLCAHLPTWYLLEQVNTRFFMGTGFIVLHEISKSEYSRTAPKAQALLLRPTDAPKAQAARPCCSGTLCAPDITRNKSTHALELSCSMKFPSLNDHVPTAAPKAHRCSEGPPLLRRLGARLIFTK